MDIVRIEAWLRKEIRKAEKAIEDGKPFYVWEERLNTLQEVIEKIQALEG
jgi:hypothetical protein